MFSYLALSWNRADPRQTASAKQLGARLGARLGATSPSWVTAFSASGLQVHCGGVLPGEKRVHVLADGSGIIVGTLFRVVNGASVDPIEYDVVDAAASARITTTGGRHLITNYWGNYVSILRDDDRDRTWVLRAPAGALPCFRTSHRDIEVYFSFVEDCLALGIEALSVNREYVATHLIGPVTGRSTALREIEEVQAGECVELRLGRHWRTHTYWDARQVACNDVIDDPRRAASVLHGAAKRCVHSWVASHESVLLRLSGGLDSSIVLACLRDAPSRPRVTCLNEHSPGPDSDERDYARDAARAAGCELIEQRRDSAPVLDGILSASRFPVPVGYVGDYERSRGEASFARQCGATAVLTGSGGDQVFFQNPAPLTVADFIHRRGWRMDLARIAYDAAQIEGWSVWRMLKEAWTQGAQLREYNPLLENLQYRTLVSDEVVDLVRSGASPVIPRESTRHVPPGKLWHAYMLSILPEYYDPFGQEGDAEALAPLHSQPLIETALRIPTYVLLSGGWDRALARRAFAAELPAKIARRRSKGGIAEHKYDVLRNNLRLVRELLLDGLLMREGLLNRANVEEALSDRPSGVMKGMAEICGILDTEVWLRLWEPHLRMPSYALDRGSVRRLGRS